MYRRLGKRILDLLVSFPALAVLSPLMAVIALLVRIDLGSPVFFRQRRPGFEGQAFTLIKFRTMRELRDKKGELLADRQRLTRLGRLLRATSLDELPGLLNVLRGEMSLIGPRPLLMEYLKLYSTRQMRRHEVRPGVTGWAQIHGRNRSSWQERLELDVWYVDHLSFPLDCRILAQTLVKIFRREGINQPGEATVRKFTGNPKKA